MTEIASIVDRMIHGDQGAIEDAKGAKQPITETLGGLVLHYAYVVDRATARQFERSYPEAAVAA